MRIYCYSLPDGTVIERSFQAGEAPSKVELSDGQIATRDYQAEVSSLSTSVKNPRKYHQGWPMKPCVSSGVHPSQAQELRDHLRRHGVPTEVTDQGEPIYTSQKHQEKALKVREMHNNMSFN